MVKERRFLTVRLRERRDRDLIQAMSQVEEGDLSEMIRKGLRLMLHNVTQPQIKKEDKAVNVLQNESTKKPPAEPMVWKFPK